MVEAGQIALTVVMGLLLFGVAAFLSKLEDWRSYTPLAGGGYVGEKTGQVHSEKPAGIVRWLTTVDHKDIGMLYGLYGLVAFTWGGIAVLLMRAELATAAENFIGANFYNALLTTHGITMLFLFGTPIIAAFGNYFVPLLIGADDMAFPRINAIAFWLLPPAAVLIWAGFPLASLTETIDPAQTSWTMYTPLSVEQTNPGVDLMLLGLHLSGVSATMGAINFIATIFAERGEEVGWESLDIFSWTMITQSGLILFAFPLLGSALVMLLLDRNFGTTFFAIDGGGGPLLWQHLFWFFGHPEVYILVLPPMGLISLILPRFAGRKLFGFKFIVYSTLAIGVLSFGVWAHHMFATGMDPRIRASFMAVSLAIAVPSAVKVFNWITTMWNGRLRLTAPMLFSIGFVQNFIIGGVTGVFLASIPVDLVLHDTYYVVGHFHFIVMGIITFMAFAAGYFWFPLLTGRMYNRKVAKIHAYLTIVGVFTTFTPLLALGYLGLPRRRAAYPAEFEVLQQLATFGAVLLIIGLGIWALNMFQSFRVGPKVTDADVWDLKETGQFSAEWQWFEQRLADKREAAAVTADSSGDTTGDSHADGGPPGDGSRD